MGIDVKDLPPAYQAQALQKWAAEERKKGRGLSPSLPDAAPVGGRKYHNTPTERVTAAGNVLRFDSQKEARRYDELAALEQVGGIRDLRLQVDFTLQEAYTDTEGRRIRAIRYKADFTYRRKPTWEMPSGIDPGEFADKMEWEWPLVVEDVKSRPTKTRVYEMKKKLMREKFGIEIQEV